MHREARKGKGIKGVGFPGCGGMKTTGRFLNSMKYRMSQIMHVQSAFTCDKRCLQHLKVCSQYDDLSPIASYGKGSTGVPTKYSNNIACHAYKRFESINIYILNSSSNSHGRNIVVMVLCLSTHCVGVPGPTNNDPRPQLGEIQPRKEHQRDCCSDGDQALPLGHR